MAHEPGDGFARKKRPPEVAMTTVENLLARKEQLLDRLQKNPGPHERREIEGASPRSTLRWTCSKNRAKVAMRNSAALNRHVERVFNPDRKDHHWERRKLARDR
jgi:hypothetical protein